MDAVREEIKSINEIIKSSPLFIYTLIYLLGIAFGYSLYTGPFVFYILSILFFAAAYCFYHIKFLLPSRVKLLNINSANNHDLALKILILSALFCTGVSNILSSPYSKCNTQKSSLDLNIKREYRFIVKSHKRVGNGSSLTVSFLPEINEGVLLYSYNLGYLGELSPGDTILAELLLKKIESSKQQNFDYRRYYQKQRVHAQGVLTKGNFTVSKAANRGFSNRILQKKNSFINSIMCKNEGKEWPGLLIGILTGDKRFLSREMKERFATSGVQHLLAVSGMHVGFLYLFISSILSIFGNSIFFKSIRFTIIAIILWVYSLMAGFTPSSVRAVIMVNIVMVSSIINRKNITLNTLCISALLITLFSPYSLFDIGFQLSYLAFLSIIFIYPKVVSFLRPTNRLAKWGWEAISLSISCTLGTSLLSISLFGYFPTYFLIANIILIPLTAFVVYLSVTALIVQLLFGEGDKLLLIISKILEVMITVANRIDSLPFSKIG